ncbi:MAG: hypothetical protein EOM68_12060 [Spirochaetia bacterium]|nr:hypothetical protein [Spirochaetia bacterium]
MNVMIRPCDGYLLVDPIYPESPIVIPDHVEKPFNRAKVISVGNDILDVQSGDVILFGKYHNAVKFSKRVQEHYLTPYSKVIAKE